MVVWVTAHNFYYFLNIVEPWIRTHQEWTSVRTQTLCSSFNIKINQFKESQHDTILICCNAIVLAREFCIKIIQNNMMLLPSKIVALFYISHTDCRTSPYKCLPKPMKICIRHRRTEEHSPSNTIFGHTHQERLH